MKRKLLIGASIVTVLLGLVYVNYSVYPFSADHPNYKDVERVFNKMTFPAEWQQIAASENRGIAGRACPIESSSTCFHKSKTFRIPKETPDSTFQDVLNRTGCPGVTLNSNTPIDTNPYITYACSVEGLTVDGSVQKYEDKAWEASFYVSS